MPCYLLVCYHHSMKKLMSIVFLFFCIWIGVSLASHISPQTPPTKAVQSSSIAVTSIPTIKPGIPKTLVIPKIKVHAPIESVGLDATQKMDVPKDPQDGGWYNLGFRPGEQGSAVIDGHLDTVTGAPAIFYYLSSLQSGDTIQVIDDQDQTYTFDVSDMQIYDYDKVPLQQVFASTDKTRLNLITCRGVFDKKTKNYSKRVVVYTELQK